MSEEATSQPPLTSATMENEVSARKKALLLGRFLGMASTTDFQAHGSSVNERAEQRLKLQANEYQQNLETIYKLALSYTPSDVTGTDLDPDWRHQFFQMAEQIFSRRMQELWARILASEIVKPGHFSLRTLHTLKQLTQREALLLERALGVACQINQDGRLKIITGCRVTGGIAGVFRKSPQVSINLSACGVPYSGILTLVDAGILHRGEFETGLLSAKVPLTLSLPGEQLQLTPKHPHLLLSYYSFTALGEELAQLVMASSNSRYSTLLRSQLGRDFSF
ncbi:TIGR03899 family protein [Shewanella sp. GXUN23E]|uniref:TIGR03899 family protein n=1 Tax=Shewanella sp. GXUN23E TaxID=3422498 RepID=UPI003D7EAF42